ncbi:MAG: helix-turn-helix transcriptional regulator [Pseudomonadota bacterium]
MDTVRTDDDWYSDEAATFGDRVAAAREALGLSDEDLARKLGVKVKTIRAWEQDVAEPRANKLQMLAGVLNVSFRWLLTGEGVGVGAPVTEPALTPEVSTILTEIRTVQGQMAAATNRLAVLEKQLQTALRETGQ